MQTWKPGWGSGFYGTGTDLSDNWIAEYQWVLFVPSHQYRQ